MISQVFIDRPRLAVVISIVISLAGALALPRLPLQQYPRVAPPVVNVHAVYPGVNAQELANTVAAPLENAINGVDDMIYMASTSDDSGVYSLAVTFEIGTDLDMAMVKVQNRVQQATPMLPREVVEMGVQVMTRSPDMLGAIMLTSPDGTHSALELSDYAHNHLKDTLARIPGVGDVMMFGAQKSMRVWLDAERLTALGLNPDDVRRVIQTQNIQAALGAVGTAPADEGANAELFFSVQTQGRLNDPVAFADIVVRTESNGGVVRLGDVARVEVGSGNYLVSAFFNGEAGAGVGVSQKPGSNAISTMDAIQRELESLRGRLPEGMAVEVAYDTTLFVRASIKEIRNTLLLIFLLVVVVCYVFLQDWRATLIPAITIPVSILGTFAVLLALDFTLNILTLFGLVLAVSSVVDDAIVIVERTQFLMDKRGMNRRDAVIQTMRDVTGPVIATTLVMLAIFIPIALIPGVVGRVYQQFAVTMSIAISLSTLNALTLSPALCSVLLGKPKTHRWGPLAWFNALVNGARHGYVSFSVWMARRIALAGLLLAVTILLAFTWFKATPTAFLPDEDQGAFLGIVQLPEGASQDRTKEAMLAASAAIQQIPGVRFCLAISGFSFGGGQSENVGFMIVALTPWDERKAPGFGTAFRQKINALFAKGDPAQMPPAPDLSLPSILRQANMLGAQFPAGRFFFIAPPSIPGLGVNAGLDIQLLALDDPDPAKLETELNKLRAMLNTTPGIQFASSFFTAETPSIHVDIDRLKAEMLGVTVASVFTTLQSYLGSRYVNDVNLGNQVNQVIIQSGWESRATPDDILKLHVRNNRGEMVPLGAIAEISPQVGARLIPRYNLFTAASVSAQLVPGASSGELMKRVEEDSPKILSRGYEIAWTGLSYQESRSQGQTLYLLIMAIVFGFLFLVAQYESWSIPLPVMCSIFVAIAGALFGIRAVGLPLSIYAQLGLVLLLSLAAKNAILIVEFAKKRREEGMTIVESAAQGAGQRYRAVLMTAFTTILGVLPMVFATGAGAASRSAIGITIFSGMLTATCLGILLIPGLYALFQNLREKGSALRKKFQ